MTTQPTERETTGKAPSSAGKTNAESDSSSAELLTATGRMLSRRGRENAQQKGLRMLLEGRLRVVKVDGDLIVATCKGDSGGLYHLGHEPGARKPWRCTCPAVGPCSHLHSLWAVVSVAR